MTQNAHRAGSPSGAYALTKLQRHPHLHKASAGKKKLTSRCELGGFALTLFAVRLFGGPMRKRLVIPATGMASNLMGWP